MLLPQDYVISFILATVFLPTLSIPFLYTLPRKINPGWLVTVIGFLQIGLSIYICIVAYQGYIFQMSLPWFIVSKDHLLHIGIHVDLLSALLIAMVCIVSWIVAVYSIYYLPSHTNFKRYFSLYSLSITSMLWILVADNLWGIFIGWELLSMSSCLLIGFEYQAPRSLQASAYAWVISKFGGVCLLIGILLVIVELGHCDIVTFAHLAFSTHTPPSSNLLLAGGCFVLAALTKASQFPFFSWLPHAMAAPTPISALLHTATVLSAGGYLLMRIHPLLSDELQASLVVIGHLTAFMGACTALVQTHIKRMLAYSTLSHLGYVIASIGLGNTNIGITYLLIHAFAKACLFLIAGIVSKFLQKKGMTEEECYQMPRMGGLIHHLPLVAVGYLVAAWGLGILPGLIGFAAKETILAQTWIWASSIQIGGYLAYIIPLLGLISTALTSLYLGSAFIHIFLGTPQWKNLPALIPPPPINYGRMRLLQISVMVCASLVLFTSYVLNLFSIVIAPTATTPLISASSVGSVKDIISWGLLLTVICVLVVKWARSAAITTAIHDSKLCKKRSIVQGLLLRGWYLDICFYFLSRQVVTCSKLATQLEKWLFGRLVQALIKAYIVMAYMTHWIDNQLLTGIGNKVAMLSQEGSKLYLQLQSGRVQLYIIWTCIGMGLLIVVWAMLI